MIAGLWAPLAVLVLASDQGAWLLRRIFVLPGLPPATALGTKTSDWRLALLLTLLQVAVLTGLTHFRRQTGAALSLAVGTLVAFWLHAVSRM
ncbi:MAG: hypothetical protein GY711_32840 [bacterium]|nr:hypothetical protein [bacterium]